MSLTIYIIIEYTLEGSHDKGKGPVVQSCCIFLVSSFLLHVCVMPLFIFGLRQVYIFCDDEMFVQK